MSQASVRARLTRAALACALAAAATVAAATAADAGWGGARVVSASTTQQAESGTQPAISRDGRYVVFEGSYAGVDGVWRKRLADGALEPVAASGRNASVSADGRWVAFTTALRLDPANDANQLGDVYVRDMELPADVAGAYTLASARDGTASGIAYAGGAGSATAPRAALSADGRSVAFTVRSSSDLAGAQTPGGQVAVRRLGEQRTIVVTTTLDPETGAQTAQPVPGGAVFPTVDSTAALSGDGTTVAWLAVNVAAQTRTVVGEPAATAPPANYSEPLWRRIAEGPAAPVRRITGGGDPFHHGCPPGGAATRDTDVVALGQNPCDGPFALSRAVQLPGTLGTGGTPPAAPDATPQLSDDGWTAAILVAQPLRDSGVVLTRAATANAYVVDMRPGLSRVEALHPLTAWASSDLGNDLLAADVRAIALSPDGRRVLFSTPRGAFPLSPPVLLDAPLGNVGDAELYDVDRVSGELRRVTRQYDGGPLERPSSGFLYGGSFAPSYSGDGRRIAFASQSPRLFFGDGNGETDVFVVDWVEPEVGPGPPLQSLSDPPRATTTTPRWRLSVTARTRRDGNVDVEAVVPAAGSLRVAAQTKTKRRPAGPRSATRRRARPVRTVTRVVATSRARARGAGLVVVRLALRRGVARPGRTGLRASAEVRFASAGRRLRTSVPVRFTKPKPRPRQTSRDRSGR